MITIKQSCPGWANDRHTLQSMLYYDDDVECFTEKSFDCPLCGAPHSFYYSAVISAFCTACMNRTLDVERLLISETYRLKYHFNIITDRGEEDYEESLYQGIP